MDAGIRITGQVQVQSKDGTGAYVPANRVSFTVDGQGPFYVDVPVSNLTADAVSKLVTDYATHVRQVAALGNK
jgi:hypothetical protein